MIRYLCGHETNGVIILDSNPLSVAAYLQWKESVGLDAGCKECWSCYCK